jgi:hypothetical protein
MESMVDTHGLKRDKAQFLTYLRKAGGKEKITLSTAMAWPIVTSIRWHVTRPAF